MQKYIVSYYTETGNGIDIFASPILALNYFNETLRELETVDNISISGNTMTAFGGNYIVMFGEVEA